MPRQWGSTSGRTAGVGYDYVQPRRYRRRAAPGDGDPDLVRLLFGCVAAVFFFKVLFEDILGVVRF